MHKRHLTALTALTVLVTACLPPDPPPPYVSLNAALVHVSPQVATACGTVTWTLTYLRGGQDVTSEAWYAASGPQAGGVPRREPRFTLTPLAGQYTVHVAEPVTEQGVPQESPSFSDAVLQTFTCDRDRQAVAVLVPRPPTRPYDATMLTFVDGTLTAHLNLPR